MAAFLASGEFVAAIPGDEAVMIRFLKKNPELNFKSAICAILLIFTQPKKNKNERTALLCLESFRRN